MDDAYAIQQTISRYSVGASRADWHAVLDTFLDDGVWEVPVHGVVFRGREEILAGLKRFSDPMDYIVQANGPAVIELDGDRARAESVIHERGKFTGRDEALTILGIYVDDLVRTPQGWRFARRLFEFRGMHASPLSPAD